MTAVTDGTGYASRSLPRHLVRGVVGFGSLIGAFALVPLIGPVGLVLLPVGVVALRGCPMCWTVGLVQTVSQGRLRRSCTDGRCTLAVAAPDGTRGAAGSAGPRKHGEGV